MYIAGIECNAESFAVVFHAVYFLLLLALLVAVSGRSLKSFSRNFCQFLM